MNTSGAPYCSWANDAFPLSSTIALERRNSVIPPPVAFVRTQAAVSLLKKVEWVLMFSSGLPKSCLNQSGGLVRLAYLQKRRERGMGRSMIVGKKEVRNSGLQSEKPAPE